MSIEGSNGNGNILVIVMVMATVIKKGKELIKFCHRQVSMERGWRSTVFKRNSWFEMQVDIF